jgi:hypothetical protein
MSQYKKDEGERGKKGETLTIFSVIWDLISSREMSSLCWTLTTTVCTLTGTHAPSSRRYSTVTCQEREREERERWTRYSTITGLFRGLVKPFPLLPNVLLCLLIPFPTGKNERLCY